MEFELNKNKIEELTKDYSKKDLNINCKIKDDVILIALLIKYYKIEYQCCIKGCIVKNVWNKKPMKLYLSRINNKPKDCRESNLELCCFNCYFQKNEFNFDLFSKIKKKAVKQCKVCYYTLNKLPKMYKDMKLCISCYNKYVKNRTKRNTGSESDDSDIEPVENRITVSIERKTTKTKVNSEITESINNLTFDESDMNMIRESLKTEGLFN